MSRSTSTSHKRGSHHSGAHGGGDGGGTHEGGGGGGGGGGKLVKVAFARNQAEAELLQGLLTEAGIASVLQRSLPLYGSSYMPGPSDVMVTTALAPRAREVLAETFGESEEDEIAEIEGQRRLARGETGVVSPGRLAVWVLAATLAAVILIWALYEVT
jgi:hypothetical protein